MLVRIPLEISTDSDIYKMAVGFCEKNKDISIFSTPEKVIESALMFGSSRHVASNLEILGEQAKAYRDRQKDTNFA